MIHSCCSKPFDRYRSFKMFLKNYNRCVLVLVCIAVAVLTPQAFAQTGFDDPGGRGGAQGGDLMAVNEKTEAGDVSLGSSAQIVVLVRNDDSKPLKTSDISLYPSSNIMASVGENQCSAAAIGPGEICAISIQVKGLQVGSYRIEMLIRHEGRSKLLTTTVNGSVVSSGDTATDLISDIEAIPATLEFGELEESRSQVKAVILRNKTSKTISIESLDVEAGSQSGYTVNSNCKELKTGAACVASVTWTPAQKGPSTGTMIVRHDGATEITAIELTGSYSPTDAEAAKVFPEAIPGKGLLVSSQDTIDFGSGISQSSSITVSLVNTGDVPLTLTNLRMANSENGVRIEPSGCRKNSVLTPLEACGLTLTWEPVREGTIVDDVQISHTGARGILVMPLRGDAAKAVNKDKKPITFGGEYEDDVVISNIKPLSLSDIDMPEDASAAVSGEKKTSTNKQAAVIGNIDGYSREESVAGVQAMPQVDVRGLLDGYNITSFSKNRAIISGPGGSRVVFNGEQTVIGGALWKISMRDSAIEFKNGNQKVLLLFDKSLSSINLVDAQSETGSTVSAPSESSSTTTTP